MRWHRAAERRSMSNEGGFHGHWNDDLLDVEYTFYGLLALGHLAKPKGGF